VSEHQNLHLAVEDGLATVTLDRPAALNALNMDLKLELASVLRDLAADPEVRALVLTGSGRAFSTGGDITEMDPDRPPEATRQRMETLLNSVILPLATFPKPVVAAVNGHAHGIGLSLALACDIVVASESAVMSFTFSKVGLGPDGCAAYFLPRLVGAQRAKELMFSARRLSAAEAHALGIVTQVVADEDLAATVTALGRELASGPTVAYAIAKRLINASFSSSVQEMAAMEASSQAIAMSTTDHREGIAAFGERRPAVFVGR
jgi:2-(1,2-epoxy-1,2-dihydrophenyl)acetyl-CoA isomerase